MPFAPQVLPPAKYAAVCVHAYPYMPNGPEVLRAAGRARQAKAMEAAGLGG